MIFNEVYSRYYQAVERLINEIVKRRAQEKPPLTTKEARDIVAQTAFEESSLAVLEAIEKQQWQVIGKDWSTKIKEHHRRPLTKLEKRWLLTICGDPRMHLFGEYALPFQETDLLYERDRICYADDLHEADAFEDEQYIIVFRKILAAIGEHRVLRIQFVNAEGYWKKGYYLPIRLEYSVKESKFRLIARKATAQGKVGSVWSTVNLARIRSCERMEALPPKILEEEPLALPEKKEAVLRLQDRRNSLERVMLHFADFEKTTEKLSEDRYEVRLYYLPNDESEVLIRILSFGPMLWVVSPNDFRKKVWERLRRQSRLWIQDTERKGCCILRFFHKQ